MSIEENILLDTIESVLKDWHIETGRFEEKYKLGLDLESAISKKIASGELDAYTECMKS